MMHRIPLPLLLTGLLIVIGCTPTTPSGSGQKSTGSAAFTAPDPTWPGKKSDGSVLLPNQWSLRPVGQQIDLADFPVNIALHPGGRFAAVLHAGYSA
ncbi:MAG TPA: phosphoesterase, partial [Clostridia bacterium]|nr:phosphoesterase [Clostridia bacterium]